MKVVICADKRPLLRAHGRTGCVDPLHAPIFANDFVIHRLVFQPKDFAPFGDTFGFAAKFHQPISARISALNFLRRPAAVPRFVVPVIVDPIDGKGGVRPPPHILEKQRERVPSRIDRDSSPSVAAVVLVVWISATTPHFEPYSVLGKVPPAVSHIASSEPFLQQAPATLMPLPDLKCFDDLRIPATASTEPVIMGAAPIRAADYLNQGESFKGLSRGERSHGYSLTLLNKCRN